METRRLAVTIIGFADPPAAGHMELIAWSRPERVRRAWAGLGVCWGLAVGSIVIPVAHFLLVPGFAVAGPVVFIRRLRRARGVLRLRGSCPDCGHEQDFAVSGPPAPMMDAECRACHRGLTIRATDLDP